MPYSIQTFSTDFINLWEKQNIEQGFSIRFPLLHDFVAYIIDNLDIEQRNDFFRQNEIYQQLKVALCDELQSRLQGHIKL